MEISRLAPALIALTGAAVLLAPAHTMAFAVYGDTLDLSQRDFRFVNGFTGPHANSNTVPDPDFPGALGAELAIRKGVAEWGSAPHGSGLTDPTQDVLGSGDSNFDAFYSGRSAVIGGTNGNIVSVIPGSGSAFAFTEIPIGDGWRIRFYNDVRDWNDAVQPPLLGADPLDIQGVMCHEYGHALGLDHSMVPGATMGQSTANRGIDLRSIEDDDIAGVQFLYGPISSAKPFLERYELSGLTVTLFGTGFDASDNEIWLTHAAPTPNVDGTPVLVTGVPSTQGGTRLSFTLPVAAGPGDIAVRVPGTGPEALSNVQPFDPTREAWTPPVSYGASGVSAGGTEVVLDWTSLPSLTAGTMNFVVSGGDPTGFGTGLLVTGTSRSALPIPSGTLLVGGALRRAAPLALFLGAASAEIDLNTTPFAGSTFTIQAWLPDSASPGGVLSNALEVEIVP